MSGYNYIVEVTAMSGDVFRFARANYVTSSGDVYRPTITSIPSVTDTVPQIGATGASSDSFACEVTNALGDFSGFLKSRSDADFVDIVGGVLTCSEISPVGKVTSIFSGKVNAVTPSFNGGVPVITIRADAEGANVMSQLLPSAIAVPVNMLSNGDIASDKTGWEAKADGGATVTLSYNPGGGADVNSGFLVATHSAGGYSVVGAKYLQTGVFELDDHIGASAYIRSAGAGRTGKIRVLNEDLVELAYGTVTMTDADTWYRVTCAFVFNEDHILTQNQTEMTVEVYVSAGAASAEVVWIDHVRLTKPDNFPADDSVLYEEGQGRPIPFLFGGHRAHASCVPAIKDPTNDYFGHVVCTDVDDYLLRVTVNTVYGNDGALRVLLPSDYTLDRTTYPGRVLLVRDNNLYPALHVDAEACEFDTWRTSVVRHFRFRDLSLEDDSESFELALDLPSMEASWEFDSGALTDSSGNGRTLKSLGGNAVPVDPSDSGVINQNNRHYLMTDYPVKLVLNTPNTALFDWDETESFSVHVRVKQSSLGTLTGWVVSKGLPNSASNFWGIKFTDGVPTFSLTLTDGVTTTNHEITGPSSLADGEMHLVVASLNRDTNRAMLFVDGQLVNYKGNVVGTAEVAAGIVVMGYAQQLMMSNLIAEAAVDYVRIFSEPFYGDPSSSGAVITAGIGHSGVSKSAIALSSSSYTLAETAALSLYVGTSSATYDHNLLVWFKCGTMIGVKKALVSCQEVLGANEGYALFLNADGSLSFFVGDGTDTAEATTAAGSTYMDGKYHCVVGVLDRSDNTAKIYVDGVLVDSADATAVGGVGLAKIVRVEGYEASPPSDDARIYLDEIVIMKEVGGALTAAEVRTHYMTATGNPARVVRNLLTNTVVGLKQAVDDTAFDDAEDVFDAAGIRFGATLVGQQEAGVIFDLMCSVYGAYVKQIGETWTIGFGWNPTTTTTHELGYGGRFNNVVDVNSFDRTPSRSMPKSLKCKYRPVYDPAAPSNLRLLLTTVERAVAAGGVSKATTELPYVRDPHVADRISHFLTEWAKADRTTVVTLSDFVRSIRAGDAAELTIEALGYDAEDVRVQEVRRGDDVIFATLRDNATAALVYEESAIPSDNESEPDPDYTTTYPPEPTDVYIAKNRGSDTGSFIQVGWTPATGNLASSLITGYRVYYLVPLDRNPENLLKVPNTNSTGGSFKRDILGWEAIYDVGATVALSHSMERGYGHRKGYLLASHEAGSGTYATVGTKFTRTRTFPADAHYVASAYVQSLSGNSRECTINIKNSSGTVIATETKDMPLSDLWYRVETDVTLSSADTEMTVEVYISSGAGDGEFACFDDVMLLEDQVDDTNFNGDFIEVGKNATTCDLTSAGTGIDAGKIVWIWVKSVTRYGLESISGPVRVDDPPATTAKYGPNTVIEIHAHGQTTDSPGGAYMTVVSEGNFGHEDRLVSLEYATAPGSTRPDTLNDSGFNGVTVTFVPHLPFTPSFRAGHDCFIMKLVSGTMTILTRDTTGTPGANEFYLSGSDLRTVTYGTAPPTGTKAWVLAVCDEESSAGSTTAETSLPSGMFIRELDLDFGRVYTSSEVAYSVPVAYPHAFPVNLVGSLFTCKVGAADADVDVILRQDGVDVATITYAMGAAATTPATMVCSAWSALSGDFEVVLPATADSAFSGIKCTMLGTR